MLGRLPEDLDIELVISACSDAVIRAAGVASECFAPSDVRARHDDKPFDLFVYHLGNSEVHIYMLELMRRYAGLTVLHDLYLGGLALASRRGRCVARCASLLMSRPKAPSSSRRPCVAAKATTTASLTSVTFSRRFIEMSEAAVVHNVWSWNRARSNASRLPTRRFTSFRMGFPIPACSRSRPFVRGLAWGPEDFVVTALGEVTAAKRTDRLIRAAGSFPPADSEPAFNSLSSEAPPRTAVRSASRRTRI